MFTLFRIFPRAQGVDLHGAGIHVEREVVSADNDSNSEQLSFVKYTNVSTADPQFCYWTCLSRMHAHFIPGGPTKQNGPPPVILGSGNIISANAPKDGATGEPFYIRPTDVKDADGVILRTARLEVVWTDDNAWMLPKALHGLVDFNSAVNIYRERYNELVFRVPSMVSKRKKQDHFGPLISHLQSKAGNHRNDPGAMYRVVRLIVDDKFDYAAFLAVLAETCEEVVELDIKACRYPVRWALRDVLGLDWKRLEKLQKLVVTATVESDTYDPNLPGEVRFGDGTLIPSRDVPFPDNRLFSLTLILYIPAPHRWEMFNPHSPMLHPRLPRMLDLARCLLAIGGMGCEYGVEVICGSPDGGQIVMNEDSSSGSSRGSSASRRDSGGSMRAMSTWEEGEDGLRVTPDMWMQSLVRQQVLGEIEAIKAGEGVGWARVVRVGGL